MGDAALPRSNAAPPHHFTLAPLPKRPLPSDSLRPSRPHRLPGTAAERSRELVFAWPQVPATVILKTEAWLALLHDFKAE